MNQNILPVSKFVDILFSDEKPEKIYTDFFRLLSEYLPLCKAEISINSSEKKYMYEFSIVLNENPSECQVRKFSCNSGKNFVLDTILYFDEAFCTDNEKELDCIMKILGLTVSGCKYREIIENSGMYDTNTGFLTVDGFHRILAEKIALNETDNHSVVFMNVKNFKIFNKKYGHKKGAEVIITIGKNLEKFLNADSFSAYLGGDNFVVYTDNAHLEALLKYITKFPVDITKENGQNDKYFLTFNAGVCDIFHADDSGEPNPSYVIENAQIAMNIAKNDSSVGNIVHFRKKIKDRIMYEKGIENDMKSALENHEFIVKYQPKVNLENYMLTGSEALVRWNRKGRILPPDSFIPLFEKNGFICQLDFYVLETVCGNMRAWLDKGIQPVKVSVNFSKIHVENPELVQRIVDTIKKYGIPSDLIEVEFTENSYVDNPQRIKDIIADLKKYGITTSMDDFGTGYSSFNMLKEMLVDNLKLDKSFLSPDAKLEAREEIIIKNIIKMAKELEIEVISEGVETAEQVNMLHCLECDTAQGFYFDKPLDAEEYEQRLANINYNQNS